MCILKDVPEPHALAVVVVLLARLVNFVPELIIIIIIPIAKFVTDDYLHL